MAAGHGTGKKEKRIFAEMRVNWYKN